MRDVLSNRPRPGLGKTTFRQALAVQRRVVVALMIREALARFGRDNLGFFWIIGEPMILTTGVMIMWSMTGMTHGHGGMSVIPFALTAYSLLTLWRHISQGSIKVMRHNAGLLFHRNVRTLDILIARTALESVGGLAAFFIAYLPYNLLGYVDTMEDPLLVIGAWLLMTWFAFAFGLIVSALSELSEAVEQFVPPILYITLPLTGAFYMVHWLPVSLQIVKWSPLVQFFEMMRCGMFGSTVPTEWDAGYLALWCLALTAVGLPLVHVAQRHIRFF